MKKIVKQFRYTSKTKYTETETEFSAIIRISYGRRFVMKVNSKQYENGILKADNTANQYFETYDELKKEMEYHFNLCKNNLFTTEIKIII